jgi:hypothetical protein
MNKRKRRRIKRIVLNTLFLLILAGGGVIALLWLRNKRPLQESFLPGSYIYEVDMTDGAAGRGQEWLKGAVMGDQVDMSALLNAINIRLILTVKEEGSYSISLDEESVKAAQQTAQRSLADAFTELAILRLKAAGEGEYDRDAARERIEEKIGMSIDSYMAEYGPALVPDISELKQAYEKEGRFETDKGKLILDGSEAAYAASESVLAITLPEGEMRVWIRQK